MLRYARVLHDAVLWVSAVTVMIFACLYIFYQTRSFDDYVESYVVVPVSDAFTIGSYPTYYSFAEFHQRVKKIKWTEVLRCDFSNGGKVLDYFSPSIEYERYDSFAADYTPKPQHAVLAKVNEIVSRRETQSVTAELIRKAAKQHNLSSWKYRGTLPEQPGWCQTTHTVTITVGPFNMEKSYTFTSALFRYVA